MSASGVHVPGPVLECRRLNETPRLYTPTGDLHSAPEGLVPRLSGGGAPHRDRILELVRPEDEGGAALEAIVRAAPRRGLARPLDDDTRRFLQRALESPSLYAAAARPPEHQIRPVSPNQVDSYDRSGFSNGEISLAEELRAAEAGGAVRQARVESECEGAAERERLGRLALGEDTESGALGGAARRLDALLAESRALHRELAAIHRDLQTESARARRCAAAARALAAESRALRYLDDVVALLKGNVRAATRAKAWPFAIGNRHPHRNYIV